MSNQKKKNYSQEKKLSQITQKNLHELVYMLWHATEPTDSEAHVLPATTTRKLGVDAHTHGGLALQRHFVVVFRGKNSLQHYLQCVEIITL